MIFILEYFAENIFSKIVKSFTKQKYFHTAMAVVFPDCIYLLDLSLRKGDSDYKIEKFSGSISDFLFILKARSSSSGNNIDIAKLDRYISVGEREGIVEWFKNNKEKKYSIKKLLLFSRTSFLMPFYRWFYRTRKRPYKPVVDVKDGDVCSVAVDEALKSVGFDVFPEYSERVIYPGLFIEKYGIYIKVRGDK